MFFLTRREQIVAIMIVAAFLLGSGVRHFRMKALITDAEAAPAQSGGGAE